MRINEIILEADQPDMSRRNFLRTAGKAAAAGAAMAAGMPAMANPNMKEWNLDPGLVYALNSIWYILCILSTKSAKAKNYYTVLLPYAQYANMAYKGGMIDKNIYEAGKYGSWNLGSNPNSWGEDALDRHIQRIKDGNPKHNIPPRPDYDLQTFENFWLPIIDNVLQHLKNNKSYASLPKNTMFWYLLGYVVRMNDYNTRKKWNLMPNFMSNISMYMNKAWADLNNPLREVYVKGTQDFAEKIKELETQTGGNERELMNKFNQEFIPHYKDLLKRIADLERQANKE